MNIDERLLTAIISLQSQVNNVKDDNPVSLGTNAGQTNQGRGAVSIGDNAGNINQKEDCVAIGNSAGKTEQKIRSIAIGQYAGQTSQGADSVAIGSDSGQNSKGEKSISIGSLSGQSNQGIRSIAIGAWTGQFNQFTEAIAIGSTAGFKNQQTNSVAIGNSAGKIDQSGNSVAIGNFAGQSSQGLNCIAIGNNAGYISQGRYNIAIGYQSGYTSQGSNSIAIGNQAGKTSQYANSIIINASDTELNNTDLEGLFINPIRTSNSGGLNALCYDTTTKEVIHNTTKTFVIDHPIDENKYLVHACLEGPEAGVYYRGKGTITNDECVEIQLPEYVKHIGTNYTINITKIFSGKKSNETYETSEVEDNKFKVYGSNGSFYWMVFAERKKIDVEPNKNDVQLKGDGPYTYLMK